MLWVSRLRVHRLSWLTAVGLAGAFAPPSMAQYAVDVDLEYSAYLLFEAMPARVRVRNDTAQTLVIGGSEHRMMLDLSVTGQDDRPMERTSRGPVLENEIVLPSQGREFKVDLRQHFRIQHPGRYTIRVYLNAGDRRYGSPVRCVDVVPGLDVKTVEKPLPDDPSRLRTYSLKYWERGQREQLFLCVREQDGSVSYGVMALGPVVRFMPPELDVSNSGDVTVRHQASEAGITTTTFKSTIDGIIFLKQDVKPVAPPASYDELRKRAGHKEGKTAHDR